MTKFGILKSIGHNISDSVSSGLGFMIGIYEMDIYREAAEAPEGYIVVDFLTGCILHGRHSQSLAEAMSLYSKALPQLCERHGAVVEGFVQLKSRYSGTGPWSGFVVTVEDRQGRRSMDEYQGFPAKRVKALDKLGRVRPKLG
jgi:hypothetical protein